MDYPTVRYLPKGKGDPVAGDGRRIQLLDTPTSPPLAPSPVPVVPERVMVLVLPVCINRSYIMGKIEDSELPTDIIVFKEKKERS
jgi:hypothetical protein